MKNFEEIFPLLIKDEGPVYTNDPADSGGPTKFGVTLSDVRRYIKKNATAEDVKNLTLAQAKSIYKSKYWDALSCDTLPSGVDYTCFDYGVNSGLGRPRKVLDEFKAFSGTALIDAINNERLTFLKGLAASRPKDQKFLKGWLARVNRVSEYSKKMYLRKDNISGPVAGTATVSIATAISQYFHNHQIEIIGGGILIAVVIGFIIHTIRNKNG